MKLNNGMNLDARPEEQPGGTTRYTKNIIREKGSGELINEGGTSSMATVLGVVIGEQLLSNNDKVIFSTDNTTHTIGLLNSQGFYSILVQQTTILNFSKDHPIKSTFVVNSKGEYIVIWTDDNNLVRSYNITTNPGITNESDISIIPTVPVAPTVSLTSIQDAGGTLTTGAYFMTAALIKESGAMTNYGPISQPIYINDEPFSGTAAAFDGCDGGLPTTKAISVTLDNLDLEYEYVRLVSIHTINGVVAEIGFTDIPISATSQVYIMQNNLAEATELEEVIVDNVVYRKAKCITQIDGQIYLGNLEVAQYDLQAMANAITTNFEVDTVVGGALTSGHFRDPETTLHIGRSFQRDEVYSFYVSGITRYGEETSLFHIPGRAPAVFLPGPPAISETDPVTDLLGTAYNAEATNILAFDANAKIFQYFSNPVGAGAGTSYWENANEVYPNDPSWGALAGTPVRLHRVPDHEDIVVSTTPGQANIVGVTFSNITIPAQYQDDIVQLKFYMVKRDKPFCRVLDFTSAGAGNSYQPSNKASEEFFCPAGTWSKGPLPNAAAFLVSSKIENKEVIFSQPPDLKRNASAVKSAAYIKTYHITNGTYFTSGYLDDYASRTMQINARVALDNDAARSLMAANDRFRGIQDSETLNYYEDTELVARGWPAEWHGQFSYFDGGIGATITDNASGGRDTIGFLLDSPINLAVQGAWADIPRVQSPSVGPTYLTSPTQSFTYAIYTGLVDLYSLQPTEFNLLGVCELSGGVPSTSTTFYTGDCFVHLSSFHTTEIMAMYESAFDNMFHKCYAIQMSTDWLESQANVTMRQLGTGSEEIYYPKKTQNDVLRYSTFTLDNYYVINPDFNRLNDLKTGLAFFKSTDTVNETNLSTRIIRSQKYIGLGSSYSEFLPADVFDLQRNRGELWELANFNNILIPHLERAIVRTKGREELKTDAFSAYVGSGDIFAAKPDEIILTDEGYGGNQSQWASVTSHFGYLFADRYSRKVFLYNGQLMEISKFGMNEFFEANLGSALEPYGYYVEDNPYNHDALLAGFDLEQDRFLLTKKGVKPTALFDSLYVGPEVSVLPNDGIYYEASDNRFHRKVISPPSDTLLSFDDPTYFEDDSWTLSYYPEINKWVSFHGYIPDFYIRNRQRIFSAKANKIARHNNRSNPGTFYGGTTEPAIVTACFASKNNETFYTSSFDIKSTLRNLAAGKLLNETFTKAIVSNSYQCSGEVALEHLDTVRILRDIAYFNAFRDIAVDTSKGFFDEKFEFDATTVDVNKAWYKKNRFIDTHVQLRLEYDNGDPYELVLYDVQPNIKKSYR